MTARWLVYGFQGVDTVLLHLVVATHMCSLRENLLSCTHAFFCILSLCMFDFTKKFALKTAASESPQMNQFWDHFHSEGTL